MIEKRIPFYGKDTENTLKRMFDWIMVNGSIFIETKDTKGRKIRTPAIEAFTAYERIKEQQAG